MTAEDVARRAVACKGKFAWRDGMSWVNGDTDGDADVFEDGGESSNYPRFGIIMRGEFFEQEDYNPCQPADPLPDMDDPATLGCFEHGMLPACGYHDAHLDAGADRAGNVLYYIVYRPDPISFPSKWLSACEDGSPTKAEAIVAALEAAPALVKEASE